MDTAYDKLYGKGAELKDSAEEYNKCLAKTAEYFHNMTRAVAAGATPEHLMEATELLRGSLRILDYASDNVRDEAEKLRKAGAA